MGEQRRCLKVRWLVVGGLLLPLAMSSGAAMQPAPSTEVDRRVALVIGNSVYANVSRLRNPSNDAADVSAALERLGFEVTRAIDVGREGLMRTLRSFSRESVGASVAVVFYAGHGVELDGTNYLIPVDAHLEWDADVQYEGVPLDFVLSATEGVSRLRVVILDACRNNPFAIQARNSTRGARVGRGLAEIEPSGRNIIVAYATAAGAVADDGDARNSPFTKALLEHLEEPDTEVHMMFRRVTDTVLGETRQEQQPYLYASLSAEPYYLKVSEPEPELVSALFADEGARRLTEVLGRPVSAEGRDEHRWTDLHYAAVLDMPTLVGALADEGAAVDARLLGDGGRLDGELSRALGDFGVRVGGLRRDGATPLHLAVRSGSREALSELLRRGASVSARDAAGRTALHDAAAADAVDEVGVLLGAGADVRSRDNAGETPLHVAAAAGALAAMEELLSGGADVLMRNDVGETPLDRLRRDPAAASREPLREPTREAPRAGVDPPRATTLVDPALRAQQQETLFWQSIAESASEEEFQAYLDLYPNGRYVQAVRSSLASLRARLETSAAGLSVGGEPSDSDADSLSVRSDRPDGVIASLPVRPDPSSAAPSTAFRDCGVCPQLMSIPAGKYHMGSTEGAADERPVREVHVGAFALGKFEVTLKEYDAFATDTGLASKGCSIVKGDGRVDWNGGMSWREPGFNQDESHPVTCVSWEDANAYVQWLSARTGLRYRLPSEAMWEYAARAGTPGRRYWASDASQCDHANGADRALMRRVSGWPLPVIRCDDGTAHTGAVGSYVANAFGLHDMLGNLWEWTADCWHDDYRGAPSDSTAWVRSGDCDRPVLRGGSWETAASGVRLANRYRSDARASNMVGFRVARGLN